MALLNLKWVKSYATVKFDTPSGELEPGQYALDDDETSYYYRPQDSDPAKEQFKATLIKDPTLKGLPELDISKYTLVKIDGMAYYDVFMDDEGNTYRKLSTAVKYDSLKERGEPEKPQIII